MPAEGTERSRNLDQVCNAVMRRIKRMEMEWRYRSCPGSLEPERLHL